MTRVNDAQEIELHLESAKAMVAEAEALHRLRSNADFKLVIEKGYFHDHAVSLVSVVRFDPLPNAV